MHECTNTNAKRARLNTWNISDWGKAIAVAVTGDDDNEIKQQIIKKKKEKHKTQQRSTRKMMAKC